MKKTPFHILRIGLAITFIWVGILIWNEPDAWGSYLMPWAVKLLPMPIGEMMMGTAILDIVIGILLLTNYFVWIAAAIGGAHLAIVLITSGINEGTVRDIGLLAAAVALAVENLPENLLREKDISS